MPGDVQFLWELGASLPSGGKHVEIGSWMGLSSIVFANSLLAHLNLDARITCIDTWQGSVEHQSVPEVQDGSLFDIFLRNVRDAHVRHFIQPLRGSSPNMAAHFEDESVDSIFVDGDHSYEGCHRDLLAWLPKLKTGGRVTGHDAVPDGGVRRAIEQVASDHGLRLEVQPPPAGHYVWELHRV